MRPSLPPSLSRTQLLKFDISEAVKGLLDSSPGNLPTRLLVLGDLPSGIGSVYSATPPAHFSSRLMPFSSPAGQRMSVRACAEDALASLPPPTLADGHSHTGTLA